MMVIIITLLQFYYYYYLGMFKHFMIYIILDTRTSICMSKGVYNMILNWNENVIINVDYRENRAVD